MAERTRYQEGIIKRYYENKDAIMYQKLTELVTELYLSEGKKRASLWTRAEKALRNMKVSEAEIAEILKRDDPAYLARFLEKRG
ncbi:MAG: hypothetical protein ACOX6D_09390 [Thermoguttaceae bacterium]|jgi:hypothetical protein